jgi:hypothetical protein
VCQFERSSRGGGGCGVASREQCSGDDDARERDDANDPEQSAWNAFVE